MKKMWLVVVLAIALTGHGAYCTYGNRLIMFDEPVTVRVIETYDMGHVAGSTQYFDIKNFCIATNIVGTGWNGSFIRNDYQIELLPNMENEKPITTFYELDEVPSDEIVVYTPYNGVWYVPCGRSVIFEDNNGYQWTFYKKDDAIAPAQQVVTRLEETKQQAKNYNLYREFLANPNMQLRSVISMVENEPRISFDIVYSGEKIVWGKKELTDNEWVDVTDLDKSEYRFFKVTIKSN